jgi:hypothetical protein
MHPRHFTVAILLLSLLAPGTGLAQCLGNVYWNGGIPATGTRTATGTILGTVTANFVSTGTFASGRPGYSNNTQTYGGFTWQSLMVYRGASFASGTNTSITLSMPLDANYIHLRVSDIRGDGFNVESQRVQGFLNGTPVAANFVDPVNGAYITGGNVINGAATTTSTVQSAMRVFFAGPVDNIVVTATNLSDYVIVDLFARCDIALPYRLASFSGKPVQDGVALSWTVSLEYNVLAYRLERSPDGIHWESIAEIPAGAESQPAKTYHYTDGQTRSGKNYYRLQSIETDGPGAYSRVISVLSGAADPASSIQVFPNPVHHNMVVRLPGAGSNGAVAEIITPEGKLFQRVQLLADNTTFDTGRWPRGTYFVRVSDRRGMVRAIKILLQ